MDDLKLVKKEISLAEQLKKVGDKNADELKAEDHNRISRLERLAEVMKINIPQHMEFAFNEIINVSDNFGEYFQTNADIEHSVQLYPVDENLPKLRTRDSLKGLVKWIKDQKIDYQKYKAVFKLRNQETGWSSVFVVNQKGVFGEMFKGTSFTLITLGKYKDEIEPIRFVFDFDNWQLSIEDNEAQEHLEMIVDQLKVSNKDVQKKLDKELHAVFANDYLCGYFETVSAEDGPPVFKDYSRVLGEMYKDFEIKVGSDGHKSQDQILKGMSASPGNVKGKVRIIKPEEIYQVKLSADEVLVSETTNTEYLTLMKQAVAIVTDKGGILCHAAIVSRELEKPCVVATKEATSKLKDGDMVEVNADSGLVTLLE